MGKSCDTPKLFKCVLFNLTTTTSSGLMIQTDLYLLKTGSNITLQWCTFGGNSTSEQTSTSAQNFKIPKDMCPLCDQNYVISGIRGDTGEKIAMKLIISASGEVIFVFSLNGDQTPKFVTLEGSSVSWVAFNCGY